MSPVAHLLIGSYRVRSACTWTSRRAAWTLLPLFTVGALTATGHRIPQLLAALCVPLTLVLIAAALVGIRLHRELTWAVALCTTTATDTASWEDQA